MKKVKALFLGIVTLLPITYIIYFMCMFINLFMKSIYTTNYINTSNLIKIIFPIHLVMMILTIVLLIIYIVDVFKNKTLDSDKRILWVIVLFFGNIIAMIIYWIIHIWKPLLKESKELNIKE